MGIRYLPPSPAMPYLVQCAVKHLMQCDKVMLSINPVTTVVDTGVSENYSSVCDGLVHSLTSLLQSKATEPSLKIQVQETT